MQQALKAHPNQTLPLARLPDRTLKVWRALNTQQARGEFTTREQARLILELPSMAAEALEGRCRWPVHPEADPSCVPLHLLTSWAGPWRLTMPLPIPAQDRAIIAMALPDMVDEILGYRLLKERGHPGEVAA